MAPGQNAYTRSYSYDRIGNITYKSDVGSYAYTYNNQPHAVRTAGAVSLQYDLAGNMTQKVSNGVTLGITWNADNKPTLITRNGSDYIQYTYDGNGTRVRKVNLATGFVTRYYGEVYEERGTTGVIHLFAKTTRIASVRTDGTIQYYHGNHLGSASVITDATGTVKETIEYLPFGSYRDRQDLDGSFPNVNYTFTDQEDDDETGLYNYRARLYDPLLGRFISADSIVSEPGNLQAFNRYSYCVNNPLVYTDPSGHSWLSDFFDDFGGDFLGGFVGAAVAVLCPPAWGPVIAGMLGGIAAGATSAAVNGAGLEGILQAAALGGAMGAIGGGIYLNYGTDSIPYMIGGGAALATARAGLEGLSHFAAGFAGGVTGSVMANDWLANTSNNEAGSAACVEDDPLKWNGRELSATDAKGNEIGSWGGVSGRTGSTTSQAHQRIRGYGPIPEGGQYSVNPQSIQRWSDLSWYQKALAAVGRGEWRGGVQTWGNTRVPINIQGGTVLSRGDFFIHGGAYPGVGTGGCIKLQNPGSFFRYLSGQNGSIPLTVKY